MADFVDMPRLDREETKLFLSRGRGILDGADAALDGAGIGVVVAFLAAPDGDEDDEILVDKRGA